MDKGNFVTAISTSQHGIAIGYYVNCDDAICTDEIKADLWAAGKYGGWSGFEGWESPLAIFMDSEADTPTHCHVCGRVIKHDLTADGSEYVSEALADYLAGQRHIGALEQWMDAYGDDIELPESYRDAFTQGYCHALLWSATTDEETGKNADPSGWLDGSDALWALSAFDSISQESIREDCDSFIRTCWMELGASHLTMDATQAGHDFCLTRNGEGEGYWSRYYLPEDISSVLTAEAKKYGEISATADTDGSVSLDYISTV